MADQLGDLITKSFASRDARTQAYATIDLVVNSLTVFIQLFGTGRIVKRFGVTTGLLVNPVIMVLAFLGIVAAPVFMVLAGIQVIRRVAEYAVAKPTREMLFTIVDQESRYKAKNVIDNVVFRGSDMAFSWLFAALRGAGLELGAISLVAVPATLAWFVLALALGRRHETLSTRNAG